MPDLLTEELAITIYNETIELKGLLIRQESQRLGEELDPENNPRDQYVIQLAVDIKMNEYGITEA